jgi:cysteinyl-tRNA synthetase, unknown class
VIASPKAGVLPLTLVAAMLWWPAAPLLAEQKVPTPGNPLKTVRSFMYQLQNLEQPVAAERLAKSPYDLLVVEPTLTIKGSERFDAKGLVTRLKAAKPSRLVVAYVDIGEAEKFRVYWEKAWVRPTRRTRGSPDFLLAPDPDGWQDDISIAFWDPRWQSNWLGEKGLIQQIMNAGFDGLYLDWVEAYSEKRVVTEARRQGIDPMKAMVKFIAAIRRRAQEFQPRAVLMAQNAPDILEADATYATLIDGVGFEDTWFRGGADAPWDSPKGGDIPNNDTGDDSTKARLKQYRKFLRAGIPVFTIDYCLKPENAARVYAEAAREGLIPLVTRVSLERLTTTPPPWLKETR